MQSRLTVKRRVGMLIIALMGIVGAVFFVRSFATLTPERVMQALFDVSAPTRFAFVSDRVSNHVAVVDVLSGQQVTTLALDVHPDFWSMSAAKGMLLYASRDDSAVFLYDTVKHSKRSIPLTHGIRHWQYNDAQQLLFVADDHALSVVHLADDRVVHFSGVVAPDVERMFYDAYLQTVWFVGKDGLSAVRLDTPDVAAHYAVPPGRHDFAPLSATPDGLYLMVAAADSDNRYRLGLWDLTQAAWADTDIAVATQPLVRPYAGARGVYLWGMGRDGHGVRVDAAPPHAVKVFDAAVQGVTYIATGWLDQHVMVAGGGKAALYDAADLTRLNVAALPGVVRDAFITADSKTALLTVADSAALYALSLRDGALNDVALVDVAQPDKVLMGATATLCH